MHAIEAEPAGQLEQRWRLGGLGISAPRVTASQADVICSRVAVQRESVSAEILKLVGKAECEHICFCQCSGA